jgi:hypothetical protein
MTKNEGKKVRFVLENPGKGVKKRGFLWGLHRKRGKKTKTPTLTQESEKWAPKSALFLDVFYKKKG